MSNNRNNNSFFIIKKVEQKNKDNSNNFDYYCLDDRFNSLSFIRLPDNEFINFININHFNPNAHWAKDNPVLHYLLANESYNDVERFLNLIPERINPNLCDGKQYGKKSLLILFALLPPTDDIALKFIDLYKDQIDFDYQNDKGRTALHYAIILGRVNLVNRLIELKASIEIRDHEESSPLGYLNCSKKMIRDTLKMIDIEPYRDVQAKRNMLVDHHDRPLILQGEYLQQCKNIIDRIKNENIILFKYIEGQKGTHSTFVGDNHSETYKRLEELAKQISKNTKHYFNDIFLYQKLDEEEQKEFHDHLNYLSSHLTGKSILEQCIEGHEKIKEIFNNESQIEIKHQII